jgi:hypothetical protein
MIFNQNMLQQIVVEYENATKVSTGSEKDEIFFCKFVIFRTC